ncbi:hypothetical protein OIE73_30860 [Streptomyces hirsutus]|uniref:Transposase n=1 Tax=Streptomyces hirsutus TaxID=35620 RepID=A0ABZ1GU59_9ACTN|nr:hypothetical protein [Streptomyces hirsutus]WSD09704.1 hypothetical protein OIE73_30860 [Streptomyces hirsutus]
MVEQTVVRVGSVLPVVPGLRPAGGTLPAAAGKVVQGEDLGAWIAVQRPGWNRHLPTQQWLLESTPSRP